MPPQPAASDDLLTRLRDVQRRVAVLADTIEARRNGANGGPPGSPGRGARVVVLHDLPPQPARPARRPSVDGASPGGDRRVGDRDRRRGPRDRRTRRVRARPIVFAWAAQIVVLGTIACVVIASR